MRVKGGPKRKNRRKKILNETEGFRGRTKNAHKLALRSLERAMAYAQRDRKARKRNFRRLWITRLTAAARARGLSYSRMMAALKANEIAIDRKMLSHLATTHPQAFDGVLKAAGIA